MDEMCLFNDLTGLFPQSTALPSRRLPSPPPSPPVQPVHVNRPARGRNSDPLRNSPLARAINIYLSEIGFSSVYRIKTSDIPRRYTIYPPLLLLPEGTFTLTRFPPNEVAKPEYPNITNPMHTFFATLSASQRDAFLEIIVSTFNTRGTPITHIAINAPITLTTLTGRENVTRKPTGLVPLYGDFGPIASTTNLNSNGTSSTIPDPSEFNKALWVTDKVTIPASQSPSRENISVTYTWAPTHTMYSHGNLSEKRRVLTGTAPPPPPSSSPSPPISQRKLPSHLPNNSAPVVSSSPVRQQPTPLIFPGLDGPSDSLANTACVDFYIGIGYFALSYLRRGIGLVYGFDLSHWAIEACRRGAALNNISCSVTDLSRSPLLIDPILFSIMTASERLLLFRGNNNCAPSLLMDLKDKAKEKDVEWKRIRHVNLGLLPSSKGAWEGAVQVLDWEMGGWIHVHENVNRDDIGEREGVVVGMLRMMAWRRDDAMGKERQGWIREMERKGRSDRIRCVHVEKVKSYAPGVWHVVYDVFVPPWDGEGNGI